MEYRPVHHKYYVLDKEDHRILEAAISLCAQERTDDFLDRVAQFITEHTRVKYVVIGLLSEDNQAVQTYAFTEDGKKLENTVYPLLHTPCDAVVTQRFCYYPIRVCASFPQDEVLQELQIESYLGSIFLSEKNDPMGLIAIMDNKPVENPAFAEHLILVLSPAIEEELTRLSNA